MAFGKAPKPLMVANEPAIDPAFLKSSVSYPKGFRGRANYELLLGNVSMMRAFAVKQFLVEQLERNGHLKTGKFSGPRNVLESFATPSARDVANQAIGPFSVSYLQEEFPGRVIRSYDSGYRLGLVVLPEWRYTKNIHKAVEFCAKTGTPLELCYVKNTDSSNPEQFERGLNVRDFNSYGFRGNHSYGVRQYLWQNVLWATPLGNKPLTVGPERLVQLQFHRLSGDHCVDVVLKESGGSGSRISVQVV